MQLAPTEQRLMDDLVGHIYPAPEAGTCIPVEQRELRQALGLARKGLVTVSRGDRPSITFTEAGAALFLLMDRVLWPEWYAHEDASRSTN